MKLQRCAHVEVKKDVNGRPEYYRCENLTKIKGALRDGRPVFVCAGHVSLYPPRPRPTKNN